MAQDIFLKLTGISGEAQDAIHRNEIDILGWTWQISQRSSMHAGGGTGAAGKVEAGDLIFDHYTDRASPNLLRYCATGKRIDTATLVVRKAGGNPLEYLRLTMGDVIVTKVQPASNCNIARPREEVSLSFARFQQEYVMQNQQGGRGGSVMAGFDFQKNSEA